MARKIVNVVFDVIDDYRTTIIVTYSDGYTEELFTYFNRELSFDREDFIGLTEMAAYNVFVSRYNTFMEDWVPEEDEAV